MMTDADQLGTLSGIIIKTLVLAKQSHTDSVPHSSDTVYVNHQTIASLERYTDTDLRTFPANKDIYRKVKLCIARLDDHANVKASGAKEIECATDVEAESFSISVDSAGRYEIRAYQICPDYCHGNVISITPRYITAKEPELDVASSFYTFQPYYSKVPDPPLEDWYNRMRTGLDSRFGLTFRNELGCEIHPIQELLSVTVLEDDKVIEREYHFKHKVLSFVTYEGFSYKIVVNGEEVKGVPQPIIPHHLRHFDEEDCTLDMVFQKVVCRQLPESGNKILSRDQRENISRVTGNKVIEEQNDNGTYSVSVGEPESLPVEGPEDIIKKIWELVKLILKGKHYRSQATEHETLRIFYKNRASEEYKLKQHSLAKMCKNLKSWHADRMHDAHEEAMKSYEKFYNTGRSDREIDLHELRAYDDTTTGKYGEAVEILKKAIAKAPPDVTWLEVIVGAGHHSENKQQQIRPVIEKYIGEKGLKFEVCNKGALVINFERFTGKDPFFAQFYCEGCDKVWNSWWCWHDETSEKEFYAQICHRCEGKLYPVKPEEKAEKAKSQNTNNTRRGTGQRIHHEELCMKCKALGHACYLGL